MRIMMTQDDVIAELKKRQGDRSQRAFAGLLGITPGYLSEIYRRTRRPGRKVLSQLGLEVEYSRVATYVPLKKGNSISNG